MNLEKIFEIFGKKIFYAITIFYWAVFLFGKKLGLELEKVPDDYRYLLTGVGLLSSSFVFVDLVVLIGIFIKERCEYFYKKKEKKGYYLKAIDTIQRHENIDGIGILFSLLSLPSRGDHWKKIIPYRYRRNNVDSILQTFSEITVEQKYHSKILNRDFRRLDNFDFDKGFYEFLEKDYFPKNPQKGVDLLSNFISKSKHD